MTRWRGVAEITGALILLAILIAPRGGMDGASMIGPASSVISSLGGLIADAFSALIGLYDLLFPASLSALYGQSPLASALFFALFFAATLWAGVAFLSRFARASNTGDIFALAAFGLLTPIAGAHALAHLRMLIFYLE